MWSERAGILWLAYSLAEQPSLQPIPHMITTRRSTGPWLCLSLCLPSLIAHAGQPLETETARLLKQGETQVEAAFEFQTSSQGKEYATPLAIEYGLTDWLQLLVEPVFYTKISPNGGADATGLGDLEISLFAKFLDETHVLPALAFAAEVKIPTASNNQIGTGATDFTPFLVASKKFGDFDVSANVGYSFNGSPSGTHIKNTFNAAFAIEYQLNEHWDLVGEVLYVSSSLSGNTKGETADTATTSSGESTLAPEIGGKEVLGMLGVRYNVNKAWSVSLGVTYDNNHALLIRPGITLKF